MGKCKGQENPRWTGEAFAGKRQRTLRLGAKLTMWREEAGGGAGLPLEKYILALPLYIDIV